MNGGQETEIYNARLEALEKVVTLIKSYPASQHGYLSIDPHEVAEQVKKEILAGVQKMYERAK